MSHYPSTAELASFRRAINPSWFAAYEHGFLDMEGRIVAANWTMKQRGCPVRNGRDHIPGIARREAARMRHDFYWMNLCIVCKVWNGPEGCDCYGPEPYGEDTLSCDVCGRFECAADLTPDWNGETGAHLSCETASA